ncbi:hypothetical protein [Nocardia sp. NPDC057030]|uniref:hypothetical protein n=1 Tax=unclassified Nocardia TaxID=2637762 RepID=UPI00362B5F6C
MNVRYTGEGSQRGTFNTPLTGEHAGHGQSGTVTSNRRELLRFGTPMETANGGTAGHRIRALGVLEIRGPNGTLWVSGDLLLRSTETPPPETISFPPIREHPGTEQPEPAHDRTDAHPATDEPHETSTDASDRSFGIDPPPLPDNSAQPPDAPPDIPFRLK